MLDMFASKLIIISKILLSGEQFNQGYKTYMDKECLGDAWLLVH